MCSNAHVCTVEYLNASTKQNWPAVLAYPWYHCITKHLTITPPTYALYPTPHLTWHQTTIPHLISLGFVEIREGYLYNLILDSILLKGGLDVYPGGGGGLHFELLCSDHLQSNAIIYRFSLVKLNVLSSCSYFQSVAARSAP